MAYMELNKPRFRLGAAAKWAGLAVLALAAVAVTYLALARFPL